jgi:hypothetical protein
LELVRKSLTSKPSLRVVNGATTNTNKYDTTFAMIYVDYLFINTSGAAFVENVRRLGYDGFIVGMTVTFNSSTITAFRTVGTDRVLKKHRGVVMFTKRYFDSDGDRERMSRQQVGNTYIYV